MSGRMGAPGPNSAATGWPLGTSPQDCGAEASSSPPEPVGRGSPLTLPVVRELRPALAPWDAFRALADCPRVAFLDSARFDPRLGRYAFITALPFEVIEARRQETRIDGRPLHSPGRADPLGTLGARLAAYRATALPGLPPFQGGAVGLFGYDLAQMLERLPRPRYDEFTTPHLAVGLYDWTLAFDLLHDRAWIVSQGFPETDPPRRRRRAIQRIDDVLALLARGPRPLAGDHPAAAQPLAREALAPSWPAPGPAGLVSDFAPADFLAAVRRAIEFIHAGDIFQVNLAQRLLYPAIGSPVMLFGRLRERNPATFAGYLDLDDTVIASASPERFLLLERDQVETRPIKGTRPRGRTPEQDLFTRDELRASIKDRAENVMIVDLLRNDLARVCRPGTVRVPHLFRVETYQFVHHLVSVVRGRLRAGLGPIDLLRATFPGGSITGAPKVRAMEIIAELEPVARGPYCGSMGYLGFDGRMDLNILIRTFTIHRGWAQFPVGGGIVAQSVPEREYAETMHKAEGLIRALA